MSYKSGDRVKTITTKENGWRSIDFGEILRETDIAGYRQDKPGKKWELIYYGGTNISWVKRKNIRRTNV